MSRRPSSPKVTLLPCPAGVSLIYVIDGDLYREPGVSWAVLEDEGLTLVDLIGIFGTRRTVGNAIELQDGRVFMSDDEYTSAQEWFNRMADPLGMLA